MKVMRKYFVFFILIFCSILSIKADILGEQYPIPYKVYAYHYDIPVGMTRSSNFVWKITNGKIMDMNGNFTLTSLSIGDINFKRIYVIWECSDIGKLELDGYFYQYLDVQIKQCEDRIISNTVFSSNANSQYEWTYIRLKDVIIESGAHVDVNGYRSVSILPPFHAKLGSNVRIYNDMMANIYMPDDRINSRATTSLDTNLDGVNQVSLYQNIPNPVSDNTTIQCYVPESSTASFIQIYDMLGNLVKKLPLTVGTNEVTIQKGELSQGMYVYSLIVDGKLIDSKRMIVSH